MRRVGVPAAAGALIERSCYAAAATANRGGLPDDAVPETRRLRPLDDADELELSVVRPDTYEEAAPIAEEDRRDRDPRLVHQPCLQRLLDRARAAADADVLVARRRFGLPDRALDPVRHEREGRVALGQRLARRVGEDEHGFVKRRLV